MRRHYLLAKELGLHCRLDCKHPSAESTLSDEADEPSTAFIATAEDLHHLYALSFKDFRGQARVPAVTSALRLLLICIVPFAIGPQLLAQALHCLCGNRGQEDGVQNATRSLIDLPSDQDFGRLKYNPVIRKNKFIFFLVGGKCVFAST